MTDRASLYRQFYTYGPFDYTSSTDSTSVLPGPSPRVRTVEISPRRREEIREEIPRFMRERMIDTHEGLSRDERAANILDKYLDFDIYAAKEMATKFRIPVMGAMQKPAEKEEAAAVSEPLMFDPANLVL